MDRHHTTCWDPKWNKKMEEGQTWSLCLSWNTHLFLLLMLLVLKLLDLDWNLHRWTPNSQAFRFRLNYVTGLPDFPACRWRLWDFSVSITGWVNFYYTNIFIVSFTSMENPEKYRLFVFFKDWSCKINFNYSK